MIVASCPGDEVFGAFRLESSGAMPCLRAALLEQETGLRHAFTTRLGGVSSGRYATANLGLSVGDDPAAVLENRARAAALVGLTLDRLAYVRQVHGTAAVRVDSVDQLRSGTPLGEADILLTREPGVALFVQAADCAPVLVYDRKQRAIAAAHAGWRGIAAGIGGAIVAALARAYGSDPRDLLIAIGPAIGPCCYAVGEDVASALARAAHPTVCLPRNGHHHAHLAAALLHQLSAAGVPAAQLSVAPLCTACRRDLCYSHRATGGATGRAGALLALTDAR